MSILRKSFEKIRCCFVSFDGEVGFPARAQHQPNVKNGAEIIWIVHFSSSFEKRMKMLQITPEKTTFSYILPASFPQNRTCFPQFIRMWKTDYASVFPPEVFHGSGSFARKIMSFSVENHVETVGNMHLALYIHEYSQHALYPASNPFCGKRKRWERSGKQRGSRLVSGCFVQNGDVHSGF